LPSNKLKLEKVSDQNEGRYTCSAQSPTVRSLVKKRTISITVLPGQSCQKCVTCSEQQCTPGLLNSGPLFCLSVFD